MALERQRLHADLKSGLEAARRLTAPRRRRTVLPERQRPRPVAIRLLVRFDRPTPLLLDLDTARAIDLILGREAAYNEDTTAA